MKKLLILVLGITSLVCPSAKAQYASGSASHSYTVGIGTETSFTYAIVAQTASWSSFSTSTASVSAYKNSVGVSDIEVIYTSVYHLEGSTIDKPYNYGIDGSVSAGAFNANGHTSSGNAYDYLFADPNYTELTHTTAPSTNTVPFSGSFYGAVDSSDNMTLIYKLKGHAEIAQ